MRPYAKGRGVSTKFSRIMKAWGNHLRAAIPSTCENNHCISPRRAYTRFFLAPSEMQPEAIGAASLARSTSSKGKRESEMKKTKSITRRQVVASISAGLAAPLIKRVEANDLLQVNFPVPTILPNQTDGALMKQVNEVIRKFFEDYEKGTNYTGN